MLVQVGIGLNVWNDSPTTCLQQILRAQDEGEPSRPVGIEEAAAEVMNSLEELLLV